MTLGQKLRQARQTRGLTQSQVAGTRITRNMLSQIENDQASPSVRTLEYLAAALGVNAGWLMTEEESDSAASRLVRARSMLRSGQYETCLSLLKSGEKTAGDEELLILSDAAAELAERALAEERMEEAERFAEQALGWNQRCLYEQPFLQIRMAGILARCASEKGSGEEAVNAYRELFLRRQSGVGYHLFMARYHLEQEHIQAAEREIWSIADLPDKDRAEYLVLRGRIALRKEQYENAALYLRQAEEQPELPRILRRELYKSLEHCYRELEDYKQAYEYAAKQLNL